MSSKQKRHLQRSELSVDVEDRRQVSVDVDENSGSKFNVTDVESIIRKFSGANTINVHTWISEFECYAKAFQWSELQKYVFMKKSLSGAAKLFVECEVKPVSYQQLKAALTAEFQDKLSSCDVHKKLREEIKRNSETYREYLYRMIDIGSQAQVDSESIFRYVIDGIKDTTFNKAILYGAKTTAEFKEKLSTYEHMKKDSVSLRGMSDDDRYKKVEKRDSKSRHCFNCGSSDHEFHNCPDRAKGPKCFGCNGFGHKRPNCPMVKASTNWVRNAGTSYCPVMINGVTVIGLIDTGSDVCVIKKSCVHKVRPHTISKSSRCSLTGIGANIVTDGLCRADVCINGVSFNDIEFCIVDNSFVNPDLIIGMNLLKQAVVNISNGKVTISKMAENLRAQVDNTDTSAGCFLAHIEDEIFEDSQINADVSVQNPDVRNELQQLVCNYKPQIPEESPITLKICLMDNEPIYRPPRRFPATERKIIDDQVESWLKAGIIRESVSDYASQVVLVKKKDDSYRLCIDYRAINKKVHKDRYPLPVIEDQIDRLGDAAFFSTLDLENGFFHVTVDENSRKFTSFVTQSGQYEFLKSPFGFCNSPSVFQKYINYIFRDLIRENIAIIYIDDIVVPSRTITEGLNYLKRTLNVAAANGLIFKWSKCCFLREEIEYLGHRISKGVVMPSSTKTKAVINFPIPSTVKQLQSFLGLAGYFRKFIPNFAVRARPLTELIKKGGYIGFGKPELAALTDLKGALTTNPVLQIFRYGVPTELHTDASKIGYGAVLFQRSSESNTMHPVFYMSRCTTDAEKNYSSYELEVLAVIEAVKKFRIYLLGHRFKVVTDCKAFQCTMQKRDLTTRVARWFLLLEEFDFYVEHRAASAMRHVDALSRNPVVMYLKDDNDFLKRLCEAQNNDESLKAIIEILKQRPYKDFVMHHGMLCKEVNNNILYVVPEVMAATVIRQTHENGHFQVQKMKESLSNELFIPDLEYRIKRCIASCIRCILADRKRGKAEGFLNPIPKGDLPLTTFHVDHLGPLHDTKKSYRYILALIDGFTKFCWLFPTKTLSCDEVVQKMEVVAETFGYPQHIVADRGGAFIALGFKNFCTEHGIELHHVTTGVPRGNGQIERLHSVVISALTKVSMDNPEQWFKHVKHVQRIINSTYHRAIKMSPFQLMIGTKMNTGRNLRLNEIIEEAIIEHFNDDRVELRNEAKRAITEIQEENSKNYNKRRKKSVSFKVGDLVAIERVQFGTGLKIRPKFLGPYEVTAGKGFDRYDVKKVGDNEGPKITNTSADKMKLWVESDDDNWNEINAEDSPEADE